MKDYKVLYENQGLTLEKYWKFFQWAEKIGTSEGERKYILNDYISLYEAKGLTVDEYYDFEFEKRSREFRSSFLGREERRLYLDLLNPILYHNCSRNKYIMHKMFEGTGIQTSVLYCYYQPEGKLVFREGNSIVANSTEDVVDILRRQKVDSCVVKPTEGSHGESVEIIQRIEYLTDDAVLFMHGENMMRLSELLSDMPLVFESVVEQTKQFASFNKSSVNTVRFMTTLYPDGAAKIIATFIKIGRAGKCIDNAGGGGNVDVCVDTDSGEIKYAIQFDGWHNIKDIDCHPDSGNQLNGVIIENWQAIKEKVKKFQQAFPYCKAAGWDIAITDKGPVVIEVNDAWDTTGQYFCRKGWRNEIRDCYLAWKETGKEYPNRIACRLSKEQIERIAQI